MSLHSRVAQEVDRALAGELPPPPLPDASLPIERLSSVEGVFNYFKPSTEKPRTYTFNPPPPGEPQSTVVSEPHMVPVYDVRPVLSQVLLDREGFDLIHF